MSAYNDFGPLFGVRYPDVPGFKARETSEHAATVMANDASTLQSDCWSVIMVKPSTADEVAYVLGKSILAIRPRLSELVAKNKIVDSGERRLNQSGKPAIVWKASL